MLDFNQFLGFMSEHFVKINSFAETMMSAHVNKAFLYFPSYTYGGGLVCTPNT